MKERQQEISMHKEMLFSQLKAAEEERQTVSAELHMRTEKIDKLKKRLVTGFVHILSLSLYFLTKDFWKFDFSLVD